MLTHDAGKLPTIMFIILVLGITPLLISVSGDNTAEGTIYAYNSFENDPTGFYTMLSTPPEGFTFNDVGPGNITLIYDPLNARTGNKYTYHYVPSIGLTTWALFAKRWYTSGKTPMGKRMPLELPQLYVRWYVKFVNLPENPEDSVKLMNFLYYYENATSGYYNNHGEIGKVVVKYAGDQYKLIYSKLWGTPDQSTYVTLNTDQWHCFEVWYKKGINGEWKLWLDGNLMLSATGNVSPPTCADPNWTAYAVNAFEVGLYGSSQNSAPFSLLMDDIVVADHRVGPDWIPPETTTITIQVLDNKTKNHVPNAFVKLGSYQSNTDQGGLVIFPEIPTFSSYTLNISKPRYKTVVGVIGVSHLNMSLKFYLEPIIPGIFEIHAYTDSTEIVSTVEITNSSGIVTPIETPYILEVNPGKYTLKATYEGQIQTQTWLALEGHTSLIIFRFEGKNEGNIVDALPFGSSVIALIIIVIAIIGATLIFRHFRI